MAEDKDFKDITPNPMEEAESANKPAEGEAAAAEGASVEPQEPVEPEIIHATFGDFLKYTFFDSKTWNRLSQLLLILAGSYGLMIGLSAEETLALPLLIGGLAFTFAAVIEYLYLKKFKPGHDKAEAGVRLALLIVMSAISIFFAAQMLKPFSPEINKYVLLGGALAVAAVFVVSFMLYIIKNKQKLGADLLLFLAAISSFLGLVSFYSMYVIVSFALAALALILMMISLTKDPLEAGDRLAPRVAAAIWSMIVFVVLGIYAFSIMYRPPYQVISYAPITPSYKTEISGLAWSGDSWSFAYNVHNSKKKQNILGVVNALSIGLTELPPKNDDELKLPAKIEPPVWNPRGTFLIFSGGTDENSGRDIWGAALNVSLVEKETEEKHPDGAEKKKSAHKKKENVSIYDLSVEEAQKKIKKDKEELEKRYAKGYPVGKDKVLLAAIDKIIVGMDAAPIKHKTAWSPDAKRFVFAALDKDKKSHIWISDITKQQMERVPKGDDKMLPLWSPEGSKILYVSKIDSYTFLELSDFNGGNARELSINRTRDKALFPLWNSAESKVIYIKNREFIIMNANATDPKKLSRETLPASPHWLTDAKKKVKLKYTDSGNIWRVFTIKPDGKDNLEIFMERCNEITQPKWSYDGKTVALGCNYDDYGSVWKVNNDGTFRTRMYSGKNPVTDLEWAASSERLAFLVQKKKKQELWVIERDGTSPRMVYESEPGGKIANITWDLLGKRIAFEETYKRLYFIDPVTNIKIAHIMSQHETYELLPYEFLGKNPVWSDDGEILAYIGWDAMWMPSKGSQTVWAAQIQ